MKRLVLGVVFAEILASGSVFGQIESFSYQGQLKHQGSPLTDVVDMRFSLYDSETAETPIAGPVVFDGQAVSPVQVVNGLFSVELDFGVAALQQGGQWLEVAVRAPHDPNNTGEYTSLTPRQHLTAAPFALSVPGMATTPDGVEMSGDVHALGQIAASAYTSNSPFIIKVNPGNVECARFDDANCNLGVGTPVPQAKLHVGGVAGVDGIMFPDGSLQTTAAGLGGGDGFWSPSGTNIYNNNGGKVGIGTPTPNHRLRISGGPPWTLNGWTGSLELDNASAIGWRSNAAGRRFGIGQTNSGLYFFHSASDPGTTGSPAVYDMFINDTGNVAIGAGVTGTSKLDIGAAGDGAELLRFGTERPWVFRQVRTGPSAGLQLQSLVGLKKFEITTVEGNNVATFLADATISKVGLGTVDPVHRLHVSDADAYTGLFSSSHTSASIVKFHSSSANSIWEYAVAGSAPGYGLGVGDLYFRHQGHAYPALSISANSFIASVACADLRIGHPTRRGTPGRALVDNADHLVINFASDWAYTFVHGRLKTNILEVAGADVAEKFPSNDKNVDPGTVMEIDPENAGKLRVAREAYSSRVAGVVSGAGDLQAGAVLGNQPGSEDGPAIALSGRVWVQCDASTGSIVAGDLLTTASTPGYAMKAYDRERSHGAVLGKAMTTLSQGERGLVLVLVNLQ